MSRGFATFDHQGYGLVDRKLFCEALDYVFRIQYDEK